MTPPPCPTTLANAIRASAPLLLRFLAGFDESNRTAQTAGCPNHPVWILGHCAFTLARLAHLIGGPAAAASDFDEAHDSGSTPRNPTRFQVSDVEKDSTPSSDAARYPTLARSSAIFSDAVEALARTIESQSSARLVESIDWNENAIRIDTLIVRVCFHNGMHAGQLTDLRRELGFARVLPAAKKQ